MGLGSYYDPNGQFQLNQGEPWQPPQQQPQPPGLGQKITSAMLTPQMQLAMQLLGQSGWQKGNPSTGARLGQAGLGFAQQQFEQQNKQATIDEAKRRTDLMVSQHAGIGRPVAVLGADGKPEYVSAEQSIGRQPVPGLNGDQTPSNVKEYEYYNGLSEAEKAIYLKVKRANQMADIGGVATVVPPEQPAGPVKPLAEVAGNAATIAAAKKQADDNVSYISSLKTSYPKARESLTAIEDKFNKVVSPSIDEALAMVSPFTTGPAAMASWIPGSPPKDLAEKLQTIKSNIGIDKLTEMRKNSPSGSALGTMSDADVKLVESLIGSLDQAQSPQQLGMTLKRIQTVMAQANQTSRQAFEQDYAPIISGKNPMVTPPGPTGYDPLGLLKSR